jgi:hypothetical protein
MLIQMACTTLQATCLLFARCVLQRHTSTAECLALRSALASIKIGGIGERHKPVAKLFDMRVMVLFYCLCHRSRLR